MNIDENALASSIIQGKLDLLRIFIKVKANWHTWVSIGSETSTPLLHLAVLSKSLSVLEFILSKG